MEKIKEYINKELKKYSENSLSNNNIKYNESISILKEEFEIWINNLKRFMHLSKYRQVLCEIENGKKNFGAIPSEHWRYKILQLRAIFHIIKRKIRKYPFEIRKENSRQNHSVLFWFNQSFIILEQLILNFREDLNCIDLKSTEVLKPIQKIYIDHLELLYLLINYSYLIGEIQNICLYLSLVDRLSSFSGYIANSNAFPLLQKIYLFRVKICLANCDFLNGTKYVQKTIDLCLDQLVYIIDYDFNLNTLNKYNITKNKQFNRIDKKIIEEIFVNIVLTFYLRGVLSELLGNVSNALDSYKQSKFFATKFLKDKYTKFADFFSSLQKNGIVYLAVMNELKELMEKKQLQLKNNQKYLIKKKYYDKLQYQKNYNKYYSNIKTKNDLYQGDLKKFLDNAGKELYKEEQNRHSILKKFTKTNYITSTMKMINNLLSKDFQNVLKKINKVEVTKPSNEVNNLINRILIKRRQTLFNNKNDEIKNKNKDNAIAKRILSTKDSSYAVYRSKTMNSTKNKKILFNNNKLIHNANSRNNNNIEQNNISNKNININKKIFKNNYRINSKYGKTKNNSISNFKVKNKINKSEETSLETIDIDYSNKNIHLLDNNSLSIVKKSFVIRGNSAILLRKQNKRNYPINLNSIYDNNISSIYKYKTKNYKINQKSNSHTKIMLKPKKEFRIDKENFAKDYLNKKLYLDKYCNQEIKFQRNLLKSKSCELDCTREPNEFDLKKTKIDAELVFNKIYELCKSSTNKKNIEKYLKEKKIPNNTNNGNMTTVSTINKNDVYSLYQMLKDGKQKDIIFDEKEKKKILLKNEEKMKELNMEYEQMIQKENEIKNQKKKLLMEILKNN